MSEWTQHPAQAAHLHPSAGLVYATYLLDNSVTNPYRLWKDWGRPDYPTVQQFRLLRSVQVRNHLPWTHLVGVSSTFLAFLDRFHLSSHFCVFSHSGCNVDESERIFVIYLVFVAVRTLMLMDPGKFLLETL